MMQKIWSRGQFSEHIDWNIRYAAIQHQSQIIAEVWNWNASAAKQIQNEIMKREKNEPVCHQTKATNPCAEPFVRILFEQQQ